MWGKLLIISLIALTLYVGYRFFQYLNLIQFQVELDEVCVNQKLIMKIQSEQLQKARIEIFGQKYSGAFQGEDLDLYRRGFGLSEVKLLRKNQKQQKSDLQTLAYYHIWKGANTNIRSLLLQYVYTANDETRSFLAQNCFKEKCIHPHLQSFATEAMRNLHISNRDLRYAFTFVRDPFSRFISAMNEVEYRSMINNQSLPLPSKVGSQQRIMEFIKMILSNGGYYSFYRDYEKYGILHIFPMIGTYLLGNMIERKRLQIYRFESFTKDWERLSQDVSVPLLNDMMKRRKEKEWTTHNSSSDPLSVLLASKTFFSYASTDVTQR